MALLFRASCLHANFSHHVAKFFLCCQGRACRLRPRRVASTLALKPSLEEFGVDLQKVLADSGLPLELFNDLDNLVPFRQGSHLLGLCADRTGCAHLGLLIGRHSPLESPGFVADMAKAAPDVRSALHLLARYLTLSDGGGAVDTARGFTFVEQRLSALKARAHAIEAQATGDLPAQVRRMLRRQLLSGRASMHHVAAELAMHRRTLDRKLKPHAIIFQALVDEVRYEVARQLLSDTTLPMITIAHSLGFAEASTFTRAFRRWSGMPPTRWREGAIARIPPSAL